MLTLALDLGSHAGWACNGPKIIYGDWEHKRGRFEGGGIRFLRFRQWLTGMRPVLEDSAGSPLALVIFEEVRGHKGTDAAHVYGGLLAHLTAWCEENALPYKGVPVATIKKHATGSGNAGKPLMKKAASAYVGVQIEDDNIADAICLLRWAEMTGLTSSARRQRVRVLP